MTGQYDAPTALDIFVSWGGALVLLGGVIAVLYGGWRWVNKKWDHRIELIAARVDERTKSIQPGANGGSSLPDAAREAARAAKLAGHAHDRIERVEARVDELLGLVRQLLVTQDDRRSGSLRTRLGDE